MKRRRSRRRAAGPAGRRAVPPVSAGAAPRPGGEAPRLGIAAVDVVEAVNGLVAEPRQALLHDRRDVGEADAAAVEVRGHGDLVGRVQHDGRGDGARRAPGRARLGLHERRLLPRLVRQREAAEQLRVGLLEGESGGEQVETPHHGQRGPSWVGQGVADGRAHVGHAQMREDSAVREAHHAVHDALRVEQHRDALVGQAEQVVGLDDLQALVHQGRGVDRDLGAHRPIGMLERLLRRGRGQVGGGAAAEARRSP